MKQEQTEKKIKRSGLIPFIFNGADIEMMFMIPSDANYGGSKFQIAKGRLEPDLTELENAIKEAEEELGLKRENFIGKPFHVGNFMKGISVFAVEVKNKEDFNDFTYETGETGWLTKDEFITIGRELNHIAVLSAHRTINKYLKQKG